MAGFRIEGDTSGNVVEVDVDKQIKVVTNKLPEKAGASIVHFENDDGTYFGTPYYRSPEIDEDYRLRVATDTILDADNFYYTAQNTGKHRYGNTTLTATWSAGGVTLNGAGVTTTATGAELTSRAFFPVYGSGNLYVETLVAFTAQPTVNVIVEVGAGLTAGAGVASPSDGAFFRLTSAGRSCVTSFNGAEQEVAVPVAFSYANNEAVKLGISITLREAEFWINDTRVAKIEAPISSGTLYSLFSLPWFAIQRQPGTAGGVLQTKIYNYMVSLGGISQTVDFDDIGNCLLGSYQGLSGMTMGSLMSGTVTAGTVVNPTAAVATNTTAALGTGLGGQFWETDTLAVNTDGIIMSFQVPVATIAIPGRRLVIKGIKIDAFVQTTLTSGGYNAVYNLNFGHTAVSLATAEAATTKAPRRVYVGSYSVAAAATALTQLTSIYSPFTRPVVVNPGEFVAISKKKVGTAPSAGVIAHNIFVDYGWV